MAKPNGLVTYLRNAPLYVVYGIPMVLLLVINFVLMYTTHSTLLLNADDASELVLAQLLNEEGGILSTNWFYSTEIRVFNSQLFLKIGLALTQDWRLARCIGALLMSLFLPAGYIYLVRPLKPARIAYVGALILLMPFSLEYGTFALFNSFYASFVILVLFSVGAFLNFAMTTGPRRWWHLGFGCVVSLIACLPGIRLILSCYGPMLLVGIFYVWNAWRKDEKRLLTPWHKTVLVGTGALFVAAAVGYLINAGILTKVYHVTTYDGTTLYEFSPNTLIFNILSFFYTFGFSGKVHALGVYGMAAAAGIVASCIILWCLATYGKRISTLPQGQQFLWHFFICTWVLNVVAQTLLKTDIQCPRYLMPSLIFALPLVFCMPASWGTKTRTIPLALVAVLLVATSTLRYYLPSALGMTLPKSSEILEFRLNVVNPSTSDLEEVTAYLEDHGVTEGYATFWHANILTELSNGDIEVWTLDETTKTDKVYLYTWLQRTEHQTRLPSGKAFVLVPKITNIAAAMAPVCNDANMVLENTSYKLYVYDDAATINEKVISNVMTSYQEEGDPSYLTTSTSTDTSTSTTTAD